MYLTTNKHVVQDALLVLPNSCDPFTNVDFIQSDGVFNISLGCSNLQAHAGVIPKNLRSARAGAVRQCAVLELGMTQDEAGRLSREALVNKLITHRLQSLTFTGIKNKYEIVVNSMNPFQITVVYQTGGKCKVQLLFNVKKESLVFNQGQPPIRNTMY